MPTGPKTGLRPVIDPINPLPGIRSLFSEWMTRKHLAKDFTAKEKEANEALKKVVSEHGFTDDKGHQWLDLGEEVEGWDSKGAPAKFNAIQRQRRVSLVIDEQAAVEILDPRGLLPEASKSFIEITDPEAALVALEKAGLLDGKHGVEVITSVQEEGITALYFEDKITEAEYNRIVTQKESWALLPGTLDS